MLRHELYPGLVCVLSSPKNPRTLVRVEKVNPKNVKVIKDNGERWNVGPSFLSHADADERTSFKIVEPEEALVLGSVVRFKAGRGRAKYPVLVVVGQHSGNWRLAPLGGDRGVYYTGVSAAQLEVVKFELNGI